MSPIIAAAAIMAHRNRHRDYIGGVNYECCDPEKNPKTVNCIVLASVVIIILIICL